MKVSNVTRVHKLTIEIEENELVQLTYILRQAIEYGSLPPDARGFCEDFISEFRNAVMTEPF